MAAAICAASMIMSSSSRRNHSVGRSNRTSENHASRIDAESAYGSDVSSNSNRTLKKEDFVIEKPTTKSRMWFEWLKYRIRHYMILEVLFFIILVLLLLNSYHISSQNERNYELISSVRSQINNLEERFNDEHNFKKDTDELKDITSKPSEPIENIQKTTTSPAIITIIKNNTEETAFPSSSKQQNTLAISSNYSQLVINAANFDFGASVDSQLSSSSVTPKDGFFSFLSSVDERYVLFDREEVPFNQAWCSNEKEPILTVWLSKYFKPTAVSYQHTKWNETIPDEAPKVYDLVACLDSKCKELMPLVSNCQYTSSENKQEQICQIPSFPNLPPINKVQFHFRENHGNTTKTCAYLVRVYGNESKNQLMKTKQIIENEDMCSRRKWFFHNLPFLYDTMEVNCTILHSMNCCTECPECCNECDINTAILSPVLKILAMIFGGIFLCFCCACLATLADERK